MADKAKAARSMQAGLRDVSGRHPASPWVNRRRPAGRRQEAQRRRRDQVGTTAVARRYSWVNRNPETRTVTREEIEALVVRERPGWRVVDVVEVSDESGPSFEVAVEAGDQRRTVLVSADRQIVGERH